MRRSIWRVAAAIVVSAACASTSPAAFAGGEGRAVLEEPTVGRYIVLLDAAPLALYRGGVDGIPASSPAPGEQLDAHATGAERYLAYLGREQQRVADAIGVEIVASYRVTLNGFAAELTSGQLAELRAGGDVVEVFADEARVPDGGDASSALGVGGAPSGHDEVWTQVGGAARAGEGVVVGVVGTGIAPDSPSFAGAPLADTGAGTSPYLDGTTVVFGRADGGEFRSETVSGDGWSKLDYSTKLVGARYFSGGAVAAGFELGSERMSPLDVDGHGSSIAGIAAGAAGVVAGVSGVGATVVSGVAPAARIAAYKPCFAGPNVLTRSDDLCALSDVLAAIEQAVVDGVDVLDYAVGAGPARSGIAPEDAALVAAAAAGVVVVGAAGDDGPAAGSVARALPGVLTVAAADASGGLAGYSGRGPSSGAGAGIASPGVTASGGGVVAPLANAPDAAPGFGIAAGTAVAAAEVSGLAAIYLGAHPRATVAEVVSAITTTAREPAADGGGADAAGDAPGSVDPSRYLEPGLLYLGGPEGWTAFLSAATGTRATGVELNLPAIQLPSVAATEIVSREVTATGPGAFAARADVPGYEVTVEPDVLVFTEAGQSQSFRVTVSRTDAAVEGWAAGALTWTSGNVQVRSPVSIGPADATDAGAG